MKNSAWGWATRECYTLAADAHNIVLRHAFGCATCRAAMGEPWEIGDMNGLREVAPGFPIATVPHFEGLCWMGLLLLADEGRSYSEENWFDDHMGHCGSCYGAIRSNLAELEKQGGREC